MSYDVFVHEEKVQGYLDRLDEKSARICRDNLRKLTSPFPGRGKGDKEELRDDLYRLHVGREYTAFYTIHEQEEETIVRDLLDIDTAHDRYGTMVSIETKYPSQLIEDGE
jgi:mRNA-degrading endonuclease RelE of RelBE toxin-antitoxin system